MDALNYLLLVNIYLVLFYGFYSLFLKDETFFKLNRIYLVGGASISFLIPFLQSDWIRALFITKQVQEVTQTFSVNFPGEALIIPARNQGMEAGEILLLIYLGGAAICLLRFIWQLYQMKSILNVHENGQAFSFFNKVKVGSDILNRATIFSHELVHARQWHSADVILFEIICIINWFNPVVYFYRKAIKHIHEFTADEIASRQEESRSAYALVLLSQTFGIPTHQLTNSFYNQSLLKRRIIMLHKSKSTRNALLKYGLSAPLFAAMMILSSASFKSENVAKGINAVSSEAMDLIQPGDTTESDYQQFLKRNPDVKALEWKTFTYVTVVLKSGKRENYSLNLPEELKKAEGLYGSFPQAPPPPPPTQMANIPQTSRDKEDGPLFTQVDVSPEFPGGMKNFYDYLTKNVHYPEEARKNNISGKVIVQFVVETDGRLTEIHILRGLGSGLDEEAVRLLKVSPNWKPGVKGGRPVRVAYTLPMSFNLNSKSGSQTTGEQAELKMGITDSKLTPLYVVDGMEMSPSYFKSRVQPNLIVSVDVLNGEKAIEKYGDKGKDGVLEITTKKNLIKSGAIRSSQNADETKSAERVSLGSMEAKKAVTVKMSEKMPSNTVYLINGKKYNVKDGAEQLKRISPNEIESINVIKPRQAVTENGESVDYGVIQITLKKK